MAELVVTSFWTVAAICAGFSLAFNFGLWYLFRHAKVDRLKPGEWYM